MKPAGQRGMALGIVLLLLLGLALLALAGYGAAIAALAIAGLEQQATRAFEAAEAGAARTLRTWQGPDAASSPAPETAWPAVWAEVMVARTVSADPPDRPAAWPDGFSIGSGDSTFTTRHFTIDSEGRAGLGTAARIEQGFIVIEPAP
jgi:Tfp pilus assembly protein PilX